MNAIGFGLLLLTNAAAFVQQTADAERPGWYASNPWMLALILLPLFVLIAVGAFALLRRRKL